MFNDFEDLEDNEIKAIFEVNIIPSKTSQLINDSGYITEAEVSDYNSLENKPSINDVTLEGSLNSDNINLLDKNSDQTAENKTLNNCNINADYNNIENLTIDNFNQEEISLYNTLNYPPDFYNKPKIATDISVTMKSPYLAENSSNSNYITYSEFLNDFYNIGFFELNNTSSISHGNDIINPSSIITNWGSYNQNQQFVLFTPNFNCSVIDNKLSEFDIDGDNFDTITYRTKTSFSDLIPLRQYSICLIKSNNYQGIPINLYSTNSLQRNYTYIRATQSPKWFISLTVYQVNITAYKNGEIIDVYNDAVTTVAGNSGDVCEEELFYPNWYNCKNLINFRDFINNDFDNVEIIYNGTIFNGYQMCYNTQEFNVQTVYDRNPNTNFKEVCLPYNLNASVQEVIDSNNNIGYVMSRYFSLWNTFNGYEHEPESNVGEWETIYRTLNLSSNDTLENTGDFKYTFKCYQTNYPDDNYLIAYKVYQLNSTVEGDNYIQWTNIEGSENQSFSGWTSNNTNDTQWAYNDNTATWYTVHIKNAEEGEFLYVKSTDVSDPVIGEDVPGGTPLYYNRRLDQFFENAQQNHVEYVTDTSETTLQYTGVTSFIFNGNEDNDAESYFSTDVNNIGLFDKQTNTKIFEAYQWQCSSLYEKEERFNNVSGSSQGYMFGESIDYSINGVNWWLLQVWEVQRVSTRELGYTGIPPINEIREDGNYQDCEGMQINMPWQPPVKADGSTVDGIFSDDWVYTGNYNPDFLGRWTKLQNGEL